jgi:oligoribonuclease
MKYISIDLETTGLDPEACQILSFSAILEDTNNPLSYEDSPKLNVYILRESLNGSFFALNMNREIITTINNYLLIRKNDDARINMMRETESIFLHEKHLRFYFQVWLAVHLEGKKDYEVYLDPICWVNNNNIKNTIRDILVKIKPTTQKINVAGKNFAGFDKKFIDKLEGFYDHVIFRQRVLDPSVLLVDWTNDETLPDLLTCKKRANITGDVTHESLSDAWDVIQVFRGFYNAYIIR